MTKGNLNFDWVNENITILVYNQAKIAQKLKNLTKSQGQKPQISGKSTTLHLPENRPKKAWSKQSTQSSLLTVKGKVVLRTTKLRKLQTF